MNALLELYQHYDDVLALIGALFVAVQVLVAAALSVAKLLGQLAVYTQSKADDDFFAAAALVLGRIHDALVRWQRFLPRPRLGKVKEPLVGTTIPPPPNDTTRPD